ncbi:D-serine deaminase-like pyridoxal phosphate-dependent protein [Pedobacter psychrotolerans]|uniref:D-serine deaminase-like pyridoxal phosphate-dependent protein n=1 Tax=Pedobacter psychrotolerans TaxID=1843235 RepID=A0A4R2HQN8_9SPHI|nr:D-TA family PLP-dependent enzyme [Pedobacter psychrotolerans]TCO31171.1 D-serine deaminase-like pyridoxal phosphate-dependent protein [Pedobacter psychrotolerans]GGE41745.1 threonine aldolase [Pedobacter psychrotolerans]
MQVQDWYLLPNEAHIETPSLIFYEERLRENIELLKGMIDDPNRLRPHVKTHKCMEISQLMLSAGIRKFKCATIAEAEMLAMAKAEDVLLAYQPVGENIDRFFKLKSKYPETHFSCLIDHVDIATQLAMKAKEENTKVDVYIDLNLGMNRTGILPELATDLFKSIIAFSSLQVKGLHAYDGHIHDASMEIREEKTMPIIAQLIDLKNEIEGIGAKQIIIIAGGTPTFPIYSTDTDFECSPGTFILWDKGYQDAYAEQKFNTAALVLSRIVSFPKERLVCADLGHKAVAAEKELTNRVFFINAPTLEVQSQSEEHLVLSTTESEKYQLGDILYGLPYHICPTVALHEKAICLTTDGSLKLWDIIARKRKITL